MFRVSVLDELPSLVGELAAIGKHGSGKGGGVVAEGPVGFGMEPGLPGELATLWQILGPEPAGVDAIAEAVGLAPGEVLAGLSTLELLGRASRCPGMRFRRG